MFRERKDGKLLKDIDSLHFVSGFLYPNRCDNEFYVEETIDLQNTDLYLRLKNSKNDGNSYNMFQVIVAAAMKTFMLKPKLNRFIMNGDYYQRNEVSIAFPVKKSFTENAESVSVILRAKPDWTMEEVHNRMVKQIREVRERPYDRASKQFDDIRKMPRFISRAFARFVRFADRHGFPPEYLLEKDPYHTTMVISNLGSLKMEHGHHHLTDFGTTSFVCTVGIRKERPFPKADGSFEMRDSVTVGITLDERLADGIYFSRAAGLFKNLIENPVLLDLPFEREVETNG